MKIQKKKKRKKIIKYFIVVFLLYFFFFHFYFCYLDTQELKYHWELQIILTKRIGQFLFRCLDLYALSRKASDKAITKVSVKLERYTRANIFAYKNVGFFLFKAQKLDHLVQHNKHHHRKVLLSSFHLNITTVWNKWTVPHEIISAFLALSAFFS